MRRVSVLLSIVIAIGLIPSKLPAAKPPQVTDRADVICFALYTIDSNILKLTAQLYPLQKTETKTVRLEVKRDGKWTEVAITEIVNPGWTAPFRVEKWDMNQEVAYRVLHGEKAQYEGIIRKNPIDKDEIVVAAFTGNSIRKSDGGDIPRNDIVENLKKLKPDLLFFSGDQVYDHHRHYTYWLKFGRDFGDVIRNTPTVTIPDDHDVGQPNLWGASGKVSKIGGAADGGYQRRAAYVKEVERAQTSHLPDPYDPKPIQQGIGVYFTDLTWGGVSFAIIEDRKFKTGPAGLIPKQGPRPDHIRNPKYDPKSVDVPQAVLLGKRQLKFLREWSVDWKAAEMKAVLSQTIFAGGAHIHGKINGRLHADLDSNGWPQAGRNRALAEMRRAFAFHIAGDQHLATIIHHGIDDFNDAGYSFCVPSIANLYLRWWSPLEPGKNRQPDSPEYTGEHLDGFHNKLTVYAAANPGTKRNGGGALTTRSAGFGVVRFNKKARTITMECWPRNVDITDPKSKMYSGWPKTVKQVDNYGRKAVAYLPTLKISGMDNPIVQVIDQTDGTPVYTLRIQGTEFRPKVFKEGKYTIIVGDQDKKSKKLTDVKALSLDSKEELKIAL